MVLLTLAAGGGLTITRMICMGSGNTTYEVGQMQKCGGDRHEGETCVGNDCCLMKSSELVSEEHTATIKPESSEAPIQVIGIPFLTPIADNAEEDQDDDPSLVDPPDLGIVILQLLSILLI